MYPNSQEVLPLPSGSSVDGYTAHADALVDACKSSEPDRLRQWVTRWVDGLWRAAGALTDRAQVELYANLVEAFGRRMLLSPGTCTPAVAQLVLARVHGFSSWEELSQHLDAINDPRSRVVAFERAANAIVAGDVTTLHELLGKYPGLVSDRSTREHRATLLHYVAANGVENYRQRTPPNVVAIAEMLLRGGSEVDAEANVYGGGATTLGLAATSVHPLNAGVQAELIDLLLKYGARLDHRTAAGNQHNLVNGCLANGRREAAEYLAKRGAPLDLEGAAGIGRLDLVRAYFDDAGRLAPQATIDQMRDGFSWACEYGQVEVAEFLLDHGLDVNTPLRPHQQTGLHWAAYGGHEQLVRLLLERGARVDVIDQSFAATPLMWTLHAYREHSAPSPDHYYAVVAALISAGSEVKDQWMESDRVKDDPKVVSALRGIAVASSPLKPGG